MVVITCSVIPTVSIASSICLTSKEYAINITPTLLSAIETVGITLPVITTMPAFKSRPRSAKKRPPKKCCVGILCVALANRFATNAEPTGDADKVSDLNCLGVTQNYSAVPTILDDQRRGIVVL